MENEFPLADTAAARMLSQGLARAKEEQGLSIRQLGKQMGYKTAVVLSHMASGRAPIPIDRAEELAGILRLDKRSFLQAVFRQRHPNVPWHLISGERKPADGDNLPSELEAILGADLSNLNKEQRSVMREVAADLTPRRRWISIHEMHALQLLRELKPQISTDGLLPKDAAAFRDALRGE